MAANNLNQVIASLLIVLRRHKNAALTKHIAGSSGAINEYSVGHYMGRITPFVREFEEEDLFSYKKYVRMLPNYFELIAPWVKKEEMHIQRSISGHTRTLKFYNIPRILSLVDMPGYGYNMPDYFVESVEEYMKNRTTLVECSPFIYVVFTKIDKTSHHRVLNNLFQFNEMRKENLMCCLPQPFLVSAHLAAGLPLLRAFIAYVTGNIKIVG
ncbi:hypothetical protein LSH36_108g01092 [Paralvinella palmiformis]|uniref:Uncharacterized protein n=1 Tax=Paralvinella palmiformis TaxID=53620 RepID=A0AAD9JYZ8_9ANNE|nr:hypothetical protein LSH36_108g01092 [Paralvinella palmiformis]